MAQSLKQRLESYLLKQHEKDGWVASGFIQRLVAEKTSYTPRTTVRRLEELQNEGKLEVRYVRGAAQYRARSETVESLSTKSLEWFEALR